MRLSPRFVGSAALSVEAVLSICLGRAIADPQPVLTVVPFSASVYPSVTPSYGLDVFFAEGDPGQLRQSLLNAERKGWNCTDSNNYRLEVSGGSAASLKPSGLIFENGAKCPDFAQKLLPFRLVISGIGFSGIDAKVTVSILNVKDANGADVLIQSAAVPVKWRPSILAVSVQSVPNETLTNKTVDQKGVEQASLSGTYFPPKSAIGRGGLYLDTKDLFSTNERDSKSAFEGGLGYQVAISRSWYSPFKIEQQIQGNQIATNLSTVSTASLETAFPWGAPPLTANGILGHPLSPKFTVGFPYTHRINQVVAANSKPLPANDFALNPALSFLSGTILSALCHSSSGDTSTPPAPAGVCIGWNADVGLWFLPLEKTTKGSDRAEGYWDYSFLIPLSNFTKIPYVTLDAQSSQMQFRIEYADSVNAANNYTRTKKWSFGIELIKK